MSAFSRNEEMRLVQTSAEVCLVLWNCTAESVPWTEQRTSLLVLGGYSDSMLVQMSSLKQLKSAEKWSLS